MGMALANNTRTPNFLYTYKEKKKDVSSQRINRAVFAVFAVLLAVCVGISFWQDNRLEEKEHRKKQLQQQLQSYNLRVDRTLILKLVDKIKAQNATVQDIGQDYLGVALISEISQRTPENIRLTNISATVGRELPAEKAEKEKEKKPQATARVVTLEGIIRGSRIGLESDLARYLIELQKSPLFDQPAIKKKSFEFFEDQEILRFSAQLELV
jgi:hypothetical protein